MPALINVFWFRRDLRLHDNAGLYHALKAGNVLGLFIFDRNILDELSDKKDPRVEFIHRAVGQLKSEVEKSGSSLLVRYGDPEAVWKNLLEEFTIGAVYTNRDYEPYAVQRDAAVFRLLADKNIELHTFKDHVIFEKEEVLKPDGSPYTVFTPYSRRWRSKLETRTAGLEQGGKTSFYLKSYPSAQHTAGFHPVAPLPFPALEDLGFQPAGIPFPSDSVPTGLIKRYGASRDFPAQNGTSKLGLHFRFGTISIREKARKALELSHVYLNELIWRDFYSQILAHFPQVVNQAFKPQYDRICWRNAPEDFQRWCEGQTGYPIVDAGMRELNATGFMHNRVRMVTASFLTKHLLIDWRLGEAYFARKLLDFDLASNNGGWQWAAGCGTDAAPYFRIFNPAEQTRKFDPELAYIKRWVPEFGTAAYPKPIVEHGFARERCLRIYKEAIGA